MNLSTEITLTNNVKRVDVLLFTRHLATMIKSGIPISDALETLTEQTKSGAFKKAIKKILKDVENGQSMAKAFSKFPHIFDNFYIKLIDVSEKSGTLDENLDFVSVQLSKSFRLRKKIQSATLYPSIIVIAAIIVGGFISFFVLPQLVGFFEAFEVDLPLTTRILLAVANISKDYGVFIAIGLAIFTVLFNFFVRVPFIKPTWHRFLLKLPFLGKFIADTNLAQFSRNLGILIKSGVPISESIDVTADTLGNLSFKNDLLKISDQLKKGKNISDAMEKYKIFPPLVEKMIGVGEKTGKLDESLLYLGDFYEEEIDNFSKDLTTVLEPILLLAIGLIVGFVAMAIITPIYDLTGSIRR